MEWYLLKVLILKVYWCKCGNSEHPHKRIRNKALHGQNGIKTNVYDIEGPFCCTKMEKALKEEFISFGDPEYTMTKDNFFCIINKGWAGNTIRIDFCPFCGAQITYVDGGDYKED